MAKGPLERLGCVILAVQHFTLTQWPDKCEHLPAKGLIRGCWDGACLVYLGSTLNPTIGNTAMAFCGCSSFSGLRVVSLSNL